MPRIRKPRTCPFCEGEFTPRSRRQYTCASNECQRERRRLYCERWYEVNREQHIENVKRMKRIRRSGKG